MKPTSIVVTVAAALICASLPVFLLSALAPAIQREVGFGEAALGGTVAAFFLAAAVSSIPGGRFADRFGAVISLRTGLAIAASGAVAVAAFGRSPLSLGAAFFLGGTALGFVDTGGARAIAAAVPPDRQGLAFGTKEASIPAASFLAGASVPVLGVQFGWRVAFLVAAALAIILVACISSGIERDRPTRSAPAPTVQTSGLHAAPARPMSSARPSTSSSAPLLLLAVTAALGGGAAAATTAFLVASSVSSGVGAGSAATLLAGASAVAIAARLIVGAAADRHAGAALHVVASMLTLGAAGGAGLAVASSGPITDQLSTGWTAALLIGSAVLAIGAGWGWTGLVFLAAVRLDAEHPAKAAGIVLAGLGLGGAAGPALFGAIAGRTGFTAAWSLAAGALVLAAMMAVVADRLALARSSPISNIT